MTDEEAYEPEILDEVTPEVVRKLVFSDNAKIHAEFARRYPEEIDRAVQGIADAYAGLTSFRERLKGSRRVATIEAFLSSAVYSLVASLHHLLAGYPIAAGHMLRHFIESVSMALLCADRGSQVLERFAEAPREYPVSSAPTKLRGKRVRERLVELIAFDPEGWELILEHHGEYSGRSHPGQLTLAFQAMLDTDNLTALGGEFDPAKDVAYRSDLNRIGSAGESVGHLSRILASAFS